MDNIPAAICCAFLLTVCYGYIITMLVGAGIDMYKGWKKMEGKTKRCVCFWIMVFSSCWYVTYCAMVQKPWVMEIWYAVSSV